ncbi:MAG: helix-turn-helix domain-containing protein [Spirochaetes bacterium]|nr:helix-turn-helix domain-containing protein [Spirochaetota bacterium]
MSDGIKPSVIVIALLVLTACHSGTPDDGAGSLSLNLSGTWKIIEANDDAPADLRYDDSGAGEVSIPGSWDRVLDKTEDLVSTVWIRKKIVIGERLRDRLLVLSLGPVALADETYVNGVFIGGTGNIPAPDRPLDYDFEFYKNRVYQFSPSMVRFGGENVIAIKIFSHYINGIRDSPRLFTIKGWNAIFKYGDYLPSFNNLNPMILSLLLLIFLVIVIKGSGNRKITTYAVLFIMSVFFINLLLLGLPRMENNLYRYKLFYGAYAVVDYVLLLLIQEFFRIRSRIATAIFTVLLIAACVFIAYAPSTRYFVSCCVSVTIALVIVYIAYTFVIFAIALYRDPRRYWYLSFVAVFILVSVSNMLHTMITNQMYRMSFSFALRLPAILLGALFVYLFDLKNIKKERDSLAHALLNKTKELQRASKMLSKADIRQEPKDIIHHVIEYLDSNFNETYDRKKLAEKFRLNEDYMGQLFKKVTNTNIANYINVKRIEAAMQLLMDTDGKVIDIAFHVGFDNLTYFYRHFKKHTGYSPIDFRRRAAESMNVFDDIGEDSY